VSASERRKGAAGERDAAKALKAIGIHAQRSARNGVHHAEDVQHALAGVHIEVKRTERLRLAEAMQQAQDAAGDRLPAVMHRKNRAPWLVTLAVEDIPAFCAAYAAATGRPVYPPERGERCDEPILPG